MVQGPLAVISSGTPSVESNNDIIKELSPCHKLWFSNPSLYPCDPMSLTLDISNYEIDK